MAKASTVLGIARNWLGRNEADGSHKLIIDKYNSHKPLARGYAVKYTDAWCATYVSAVAIEAGATDIIPLECGCGQMITLADKMGIWIENENRVPNPGEICMYDWDDGTNFKATDNKGWPEHVGYVDSVDTAKGTFVVIEGNYSNSVKRRTLEINGRYIRGFITPKYEAEIVVSPVIKDIEKHIWDFLMSKFNNPCGVAGLMGNLYAESALASNNAQNTGNKKLGMTDAEYTAAVDNGSYTNFIRDSIGYGLAQWTYWSRKEALLNFAKSKNVSIGDLDMQLEFLVKELSGYKRVLKAVTNGKTVREASDSVLLEFERPADTSLAVQQKRAEYGQKYYDKYVVKVAPVEPAKPVKPVVKMVATDYAKSLDKKLAGKYTVTASGGLYLRHGAGVGKKHMVVLPKGTVVNNYGYYTSVLGTKWLYIQVTLNGVQYTGFSSSKYLKK